MIRRAVFLDRDGTLNTERSFVTDPSQLELLPGVVPALRELRAAGLDLIVITNQSGIARGLYDETTLAHIHARLHGMLEELPRGYFHCPHHPEQAGPHGRECTCRKPKTGLIEAAAELLGIDLSRSFVVGDSARDLHGGSPLGLRTVLVRSGKPWRDQLDSLVRSNRPPDHVADDLLAATPWLLEADAQPPPTAGR